MAVSLPTFVRLIGFSRPWGCFFWFSKTLNVYVWCWILLLSTINVFLLSFLRDIQLAG